MTLLPCSWLLRLAVLSHLTVLLAGQHHGVKKCRITCNKMTSAIPVANLVSYQQNHKSCGQRAIILETRKQKLFCANPMEKWVQEAMAYLDRRAGVLTSNGGTFEKQIGGGEPRTTLATRGEHQSALSEPEVTTPGSHGLELTPPSLETEKAWGMSPDLPTGGAVGSSGTSSPSVSKAEAEGPPTGPVETELLSWVAAVSTPLSSTAYQPGSDLPAAGKAPQAPHTEGPTIQGPTTEVFPTQGPPTEALTSSHPALENTVGLGGQSVRVEEWSPTLESAPESKKMGPGPAHTDAFLDWGPGSMAHTSVVPVSSEGVPSRELEAEGSWTSNTDEPIHATVDPQRLGILITPVPDAQAATRRQAVGLLAFLGLLFCLGVAMFAYQSLQGCSHKMAGDMVEGLRYVPRSCGSNSYVLVPV
ncbi:fractalkine [Tenrec ecaudatus]|uniref:fractalkine n=1 Tax=Tenrec ecaudatus TaxID=94439 RepID=UPI003F5A05AC